VSSSSSWWFHCSGLYTLPPSVFCILLMDRYINLFSFLLC
jgi:hypothetical protein